MAYDDTKIGGIDILDKGGLKYLRLGSQNVLLLIVGGAGSGKSVLLNSIAWQSKQYKNAKVIYLTEKPSSPMENCFCGIERKNSFMETQIIRDNLHADKVAKKMDIEIYHPFTFNFPKTKVPDCMKLFTLPLKSVQDESFSALLGRDMDSPSVMLAQEVKENLDETSEIYSFLFEAFKKSSLMKDEEVKLSKNISRKNMGIPIESFGSKRDLEQIKHTFRNLERHYFLQDELCDLNLDEEKFKDIIRNDKITFFTMWQLNDKKLQYFLYIELLYKLYKYIPKYGNRPILLILEEIKILLPRTADLNYEKGMVKILREMLAGIRSCDTDILASTQSYFETNKDFTDGINEVLLMKVTLQDLRRLNKEFGLSSSNYKVLNSLETGQCTLMKELIEGNRDNPITATKYRVFYVPFAHREKGYPPFWYHWKKHYPHKMVSYNDVIKKMKRKKDNNWKDHEHRIKKYLRELERKNEKPEENKEDKPKKKEKVLVNKEIAPAINMGAIEQNEDYDPATEDMINKYKEELPVDDNPRLSKIKEENVKVDQKKNDKSKECYDITNKTPEYDWETRALLVDLDPEEMKKKATEYAKEIGDEKFIDKLN